MANYTQYKRLELPSSPEHYDINIFNKNTMVIDSELNKLELKNQSQDNLLATKESLNSEISRATTQENKISASLNAEITRAETSENELSNNLISEINRAVIAEEHLRESLSNHIADKSNPHQVTPQQMGLGNVDNTSDIDKPVSTAQQNAIDLAVSNHESSTTAHSDIRSLILGLATRLNVLADSDDTTLDQLSEIVAYIKNNKSLIDAITTSKVDKVPGKELSTNDYTTAEKNKLKDISPNAQVNVQADWNVTDETNDAFIKNKPITLENVHLINNFLTTEPGLGAADAKTVADLYSQNTTLANSLDQINNNLKGFEPIIDDTGRITGYKTSVGGADTVFPFSSSVLTC